MRVHELAKELGVKSKDLLSALEEMGYAGRTASSSVPDETVARLRASGGKAVPGSKPKQIRVEQLPTKRPAKQEAPAKEEVAAPAPAGDGQTADGVAELEGPALTPEPGPAEPAVEPTLPVLKLSRGASPQDVAEKTGRTPAEVVKVLLGMGEMVAASQSLPDDVLSALVRELGHE